VPGFNVGINSGEVAGITLSDSDARGVSGAGGSPFTGLEWKSHRGLLLHPQPKPAAHRGLQT